MILLREVLEKDIDELERLSQIASEKHPGLFNLSIDRDQWLDRIKVSRKSFLNKLENPKKAKFVFVAENTETKKLVGVSMVSVQHGTPEIPHYYFQVGNEKKYSETINTGFIHGTLELKIDSDGPSEIGGLLVDPNYRSSDEKVGRQISFVRFLYMSMYREKFRKKVLAELLPPLTKKGKSPLWEAVGRRFTNMDYTEADLLSAKNKEFIFSLFPSGKIYVTFLSAEARNAIGKVSKETEPVMHMLKKIGFEYLQQVDPFDGGPHLWADFDSIKPIKFSRQLIYSGSKELSSAVSGLCSSIQKTKEFEAAAVLAEIENDEIYFDESVASTLKIQRGDTVQFSPFYN
jgi:arginine N-succinyltransferase